MDINMYRDRKNYVCSGCGKVAICEAIPPGWTQARDNSERCMCEQCRSEMGLVRPAYYSMRHVMAE